MQAVVEVPNFDFHPLPPWPVSAAAPYSFMPIHPTSSDTDVGLFVSALICGLEGDHDDPVAALLAEGTLSQPGGLRLTDTATRAVVAPGCCAGLEDWREWVDILAGQPPWLGHGPTPEVEIGIDELRVWQDNGANRHIGQSIVVERSALPELLNSVHRDLTGFLTCVQTWSERNGLGSKGTDLVEAIDRNFHMTAPLIFPEH
ncbi:hypothetical protein FNL39_11481 [Nocardia caishijiensis]|uniref:Uncharacterized protein n=2 Tax=Nocardia caishijiensis TaxID=184756 RepID=A0ABQ6YF37_9NOCA|nr:hypothetical protein FNL39_11481 [Nocardia caishijiensis]